MAALLRSNHGVSITADWTEATIAVDDIIDSGRTAQQVWKRHNLKVEALIVKETNDWIVFPWEGTELSEDAEHTVTRFLEQIGEDPNRPGLQDMPRRVVRLWGKLFSGYNYSQDDLDSLLPGGISEPSAKPAPASQTRPSQTRPDAGTDDNEIVVLPATPFISACENHLLPFFGVARVGLLSSGTLPPPCDVSKLVNALSRRLQLQERLASQICDALQPRAESVAVLLEGACLCAMAQGRHDSPSAFRATSYSGAFQNSEELQSRFLIRSSLDTAD